VTQEQHKADAPAAVSCYILTVSDTRTADTDTSGRAIRQLLEAAGHHVAGVSIVGDEPALVRQTVEREVMLPQTQAVIITGGTGLTSRDSSYEAIADLLDKRLDGFGELFRMLSYQEIGPAAMMSRAVAGAAGGKAIFLLPGSEKAVRLAMEKLIVPELGHVVQQLRR
jgi:molybdenum cofactor biosynthesis protein B